jgi:hypothetical protein
MGMGHRAIEVMVVPTVTVIVLILAFAATWKSMIWAFKNPSAPSQRRH